MKRPSLNEIPLEEAMESLLSGNEGALVVTMSEGQWDGLLAVCYESEDAILLELDDDELPVHAYRRLRQ